MLPEIIGVTEEVGLFLLLLDQEAGEEVLDLVCKSLYSYVVEIDISIECHDDGRQHPASSILIKKLDNLSLQLFINLFR